jgi:potassium-dependent mechanosensitive channel
VLLAYGLFLARLIARVANSANLVAVYANQWLLLSTQIQWLLLSTRIILFDIDDSQNKVLTHTAFSYAGFNLSNLAILAGAFSVGIGFGLQSVVNNFVSGLILLAERPIKVLVVVAGEEGYVRKISVRSTEVETSERARVLVPNYYFITEKVKNWTLRDNTRRIVIPVSVGYGCDPRKVMATLLKVAQDNPDVMTMPAPSVDFDFGADTLNFKIYAFVYDLNKGGSTSTDLRIAILDAFNEAGIAMPF